MDEEGKSKWIFAHSVYNFLVWTYLSLEIGFLAVLMAYVGAKDSRIRIFSFILAPILLVFSLAFIGRGIAVFVTDGKTLTHMALFRKKKTCQINNLTNFEVQRGRDFYTLFLTESDGSTVKMSFSGNRAIDFLEPLIYGVFKDTFGKKTAVIAQQGLEVQTSFGKQRFRLTDECIKNLVTGEKFPWSTVSITKKESRFWQMVTYTIEADVKISYNCIRADFDFAPRIFLDRKMKECCAHS